MESFLNSRKALFQKYLNKSLIVTPLTLVTLAILYLTPASAQPTFTGDAVADFGTFPGVIMVLDPDGPGDVGLPVGAPLGTVSGWDIQAAYLYYDPIIDTLYVGIDCNGVCGDADGNGNPGTTATWLAGLGGADLPDYSGDEVFAMVFDPGNDGLDNGTANGPDIVVGVSDTTDFAGFTAAQLVGGPFVGVDPGSAFGATLPNMVTVFANPSAIAPDLEFTIADFSTLPGFSFTPGESFTFGLNVAHGSQSDDGIGEDFLAPQGSGGPGGPGIPIPATLDLGDAPDPSFPTLLANSGARHVLGSNVYLGACVDSEPDGQPSTAADDDDTNLGTYVFGTCLGDDDEDGVTFTTPLFIGATTNVDVEASAACTLSAWLDFNGDGDWADPDENLFPGDQMLNPGVNNLSILVPTTAVTSTTWARFRCTTDGAVSYTGQASDGEVEDYQVAIQAALDFGDAPDPTFPTLLANNGASHVLGSSVWLGDCVDAETDGLPSSAANGDDLDAGGPVFGTCVGNNDEDGVIFTTPLSGGAIADVEVTASATCTLSAWLDFNGDGDWADPDEDLFPGGQTLTPGVNNLSYLVPTGAVTGTTWARFRCTTDGAVPYTGQASDGEIEDYQVAIQATLDFGDAPDPTFPTLLASGGASHALGSGVYLGACVDAEADGLPSSAADGDDLDVGSPVFGTCVSNNDEDGVIFTNTLSIGAIADVEVTASATCTLSAWIDFNEDGDWADPDEDLFPGGQTLTPGVNNLSFLVPTTAVTGTTWSRFRCTTDGAVPYTGQASDGETEDYQVTVGMPIINATKTDSLLVDNNGDGQTNPNDTLRYTVAISNNGTGDAANVVFNDTPDANTSLVVGSVTSTLGTVTSGNGAGDTTVAVNIGTLSRGGGSATIRFEVTIGDPLPVGVNLVSNQGIISSSNFADMNTDDPDTATPSDPTTTPVDNLPAPASDGNDNDDDDDNGDDDHDDGDKGPASLPTAPPAVAAVTGVALPENDPLPAVKYLPETGVGLPGNSCVFGRLALVKATVIGISLWLPGDGSTGLTEVSFDALFKFVLDRPTNDCFMKLNIIRLWARPVSQ